MKKITPPMSRDDSLVVVLGKVEGGGRWKATNESRRLVGGLFWPGSRAERRAKPPTSRDDSLVVVEGEVEGGGRWMGVILAGVEGLGR